jgi:hypothetical protein
MHLVGFIIKKFPIFVCFGSIMPTFTKHGRRIAAFYVAVTNKQAQLAIKATEF